MVEKVCGMFSGSSFTDFFAGIRRLIQSKRRTSGKKFFIESSCDFPEQAGKNHKVYAGKVIGNAGENGDSLITGVDYETNSDSDSAFCRE